MTDPPSVSRLRKNKDQRSVLLQHRLGRSFREDYIDSAPDWRVFLWCWRSGNSKNHISTLYNDRRHTNGFVCVNSDRLVEVWKGVNYTVSDPAFCQVGQSRVSSSVYQSKSAPALTFSVVMCSSSGVCPSEHAPVNFRSKERSTSASKPGTSALRSTVTWTAGHLSLSLRRNGRHRGLPSTRLCHGVHLRQSLQSGFPAQHEEGPREEEPAGSLATEDGRAASSE